MTRRTVFSRILGAVGFAVAAKALPSCPRSGQTRTVLPSRVHDKDLTAPMPPAPAGTYHHLWLDPNEMWRGDPVNHDLPIRWWLQGQNLIPLTEEQKAEAFGFACGKQWASDVAAQRGAIGRPCLTFNRIHGMVERAVLASRRRNETYTYEEYREATAQIAARNRDAQNLYNYFMSQFAESIALQPERKLRVLIQYENTTGHEDAYDYQMYGCAKGVGYTKLPAQARADSKT